MSAAARCTSASPSSVAARRGWPSLTGTPRQILWAEQIRERLVAGVERSIRAGQGIARTAAHQSTRDWLLAQTSAAWWIENRDKKPSTIPSARYREVIELYGSLLGPRKVQQRVL